MIDDGSRFHSCLGHLRREVAQAVVQLAPGQNVSSEMRPVHRRCPRWHILTVAIRRLAPPCGRGAVTMLPAQQCDRVVDQHPRDRFVDVGQFAKLDIAGLAAEPSIGLAGLGVQAEGDESADRRPKFEFLLRALFQGRRSARSGWPQFS